MQKINSFFKLIRWPNLVFIILTQVAFYFFVVISVYNNVQLRLQLPYFILLVIASVCIAAGGYIINDYFDVNIDSINKPNKLIVGKIFKRRKAIIYHFIFSLIGILLSFYISYLMHQRFWWLGFCNLLVVTLLVIYSASLKKKLLIGNITIAFLTAWVIIVIALSQFQLTFVNANDALVAKESYSKLFRIGILYATFAFIITLMREIVKDMEDYIGDIKEGCKTLPIVYGFTVAKVFVAISTIILMCLIIVLQFYILQYSWYGAILYCLLLVLLPLLFTTKILVTAVLNLHYHTLSTMYKYIMLAGILSMLFFKIYA